MFGDPELTVYYFDPFDPALFRPYLVSPAGLTQSTHIDEVAECRLQMKISTPRHSATSSVSSYFYLVSI